MQWIQHGERPIYESEWVDVTLVDVEVPGIRRFEHHVLRVPDAAGVVVRDPERGFLLLWRHRFITDSWGWEVPAGRIDEGETPEEAAVRETLEESGWRPGPLTKLVRFFPANGISDLGFHVYTADSATYVGAPSDPSESSRVDWVTEDAVRAAIRAGELQDGFSLTAVCYALALG